MSNLTDRELDVWLAEHLPELLVYKGPETLGPNESWTVAVVMGGWASTYEGMGRVLEAMRERGFEPELVPYDDVEDSAGFWLVHATSAAGQACAPRGQWPRAVAEAAKAALEA